MGSEQLYAIIYQVHNTFNERHYYVNAWQEHSKHEQKKAFYVSPFLPMQLQYQFLMSNPGKSIKQDIQQTNDQHQLVFAASYQATSLPLTDKNLLKLFLSIPFMTLSVFIKIHWQAVKLIAKGIRIVKKENFYQKRKAEKL